MFQSVVQWKKSVDKFRIDTDAPRIQRPKRVGQDRGSYKHRDHKNRINKLRIRLRVLR